MRLGLPGTLGFGDAVSGDHTPTRGEPFAGQVRHVYVHVPFCRERCDYCDFYSEVTAEGGGPRATARFDAYVAALLREWEREAARHDVRRVSTVYVGGGTPALLGAARLERLLAAFDGRLTPAAEVTVEANPDEIDETFAHWAARRGVRVSLGVQSFQPHLRAALGRRPASDPAAAVRRLRAAGVRELSIDLILAIPGQTAADVEADLAAVAGLSPEHVSWYELDVVPGTPLARRLGDAEGDRLEPAPPSDDDPGVVLDAGKGESGGAAGAPFDIGLSRPDDDVRAAYFRRIVGGLDAQGLRWYEVSNFARPGHRSRHNGAYWRARPYVGLGPAAVSTVGRRRWRNAPDTAAYVRDLAAGRAPRRETETLDELTLARERLMLAARCGLPVPLAEVAPALATEAVSSLVEAGLLSLHSGTIRVTRKGRYLANGVCVRLFRA